MRKIAVAIFALLLVFLWGAGTALAGSGKGKGVGAAGGESPGKVERVNYENKEKQQEVEQIKGLVKEIEKTEKNREKFENKLRVREELRQRLRVYNQGEGIRNAFADCENHWARLAIEKMSAVGLFDGYEDGTFKPNKPITQVELIAVLMRVTAMSSTAVADENGEDNEQEGVDEEAGEENMSGEQEGVVDNELSEGEGNVTEEELAGVPEWARGVVKEAAQMRVINLNRFHSHVQATRAQAAVWIAKSLGLEPVQINVDELPFTDGVLISPEDAGYIMALYKEGIITGMPGGKFNPNSAITRAQMAAILERLLTESVAESDEGASDVSEAESGSGEEVTVEQPQSSETGAGETE